MATKYSSNGSLRIMVCLLTAPIHYLVILWLKIISIPSGTSLQIMCTICWQNLDFGHLPGQNESHVMYAWLNWITFTVMHLLKVILLKLLIIYQAQNPNSAKRSLYIWHLYRQYVCQNDMDKLQLCWTVNKQTKTKILDWRAQNSANIYLRRASMIFGHCAVWWKFRRKVVDWG